MNARVAGWERRRQKYGPSGRGHASRSSDKIADDQYRLKLKAHTKISERGCWEWQGWVHPRGYAWMGYRGRSWKAHRLAYTLWKGPIPEGMVICHTCDIRHCVNPDHLFMGTYDTNNKDMAAKGRCKYSAEVWPCCKSGHEFTPQNTRICKRGFRHCKQCEKDRFATPEYKAWARTYRKQRRAKLKAQRLGMSENDG